MLDSKKSYVRHISHELRTPLNTAFLGLKLLTSELKASSDPKEIERYDTLCDVNLSCAAAVDILNDLLCYEKLDSGILELHKEDVPILPFLSDCLTMFSVQARECAVTMTLVPAPTPTAGLSDDSCVLPSLPLNSDDVLYVDKFKMDQVIRNLISNALKFTPRGGSVTISATFVPDIIGETETLAIDNSTSCFRQLPDLSCCSLFPCTTRTNAGPHPHCYPKRVSPSSDLTRPQSSCNLVVPDPSAFITHDHDSDVTTLFGKLVIVVTDSGVGISIENQARLFRDIVQFSPEKLQAGGGSGLGLWITGGIVDLHGGKISVHSEGEGKGCSFTVEIPMIRRRYNFPSRQHSSFPIPLSHMQSPESRSSYSSSAVAQVHSMRKAHTMEHMNSAPSPRSVCREGASQTEVEVSVQSFDVLIVDDSKLNRKMLSKCLRSDGHSCSEAEDGLDAVMKVKERMEKAKSGGCKMFDVILMDFVMPNLDGPGATRQIRAMGYTGPIFGVTGNGEDDPVQH